MKTAALAPWIIVVLITSELGYRDADTRHSQRRLIGVTQCLRVEKTRSGVDEALTREGLRSLLQDHSMIRTAGVALQHPCRLCRRINRTASTRMRVRIVHATRAVMRLTIVAWIRYTVA